MVSATIVGPVITAYKNGVLMAQATDAAIGTGNPGIDFNLENAQPQCCGTNDRYGFSAFSATDTVGT